MRSVYHNTIIYLEYILLTLVDLPMSKLFIMIWVQIRHNKGYPFSHHNLSNLECVFVLKSKLVNGLGWLGKVHGRLSRAVGLCAGLGLGESFNSTTYIEYPRIPARAWRPQGYNSDNQQNLISSWAGDLRKRLTLHGGLISWIEVIWTIFTTLIRTQDRVSSVDI